MGHFGPELSLVKAVTLKKDIPCRQPGRKSVREWAATKNVLYELNISNGLDSKMQGAREKSQ